MKNATVFVFPEAFEIDTLKILDHKNRARPIGQTESECWGIVSIDGAEMIAPIAGAYMISIQRQERKVPADVVKEMLAERVADFEDRSIELSAADKRDMKEDVIIELLPQVFPRKKVFHAWLGKDRLIIDSKSPTVCDAITSLLREALGSLPCINVKPRSVSGAVMAGWLQNPAVLPHHFDLVGETNLRAQEDETGKIKIKDSDLNQESIDDALACCPMVSDMALSHNDAISFTLNENLQLGKIKLSDTLQGQLSDDSEGDKAQEQRASWLLEVSAINGALTDIFAAMGGVEGVDE